jgi:hypothetical protein
MFEPRRRCGIVALTPEQAGPLQLGLWRFRRIFFLFDDAPPQSDG